MAQRLRRIEAVCAAAFTLIVVWPFVRPGSWPTVLDTGMYSGPNLAVTFRALRRGHIPAWNDAIYGGAPHLANIQAAVLYPLKWPFVTLGVHRALLSLIALHLVILAAGVYHLLRRQLGWPAPAGAVGVIVCLGSGCVMVRSLFLEQILVLAWFPWLWASVDAVLRRARPARATAALAVVTALVLLAGHPQVTYLLIPTTLLWALGRAWDTNSWRRLANLALGSLVGALLAAPQLLPTLELSRRAATAGGRTLESVSVPAAVLPVRSLFRVLFVDAFTSNPVAGLASSELLSFVGAGAVALAMIAVAQHVVVGRIRGPGAAGEGAAPSRGTVAALVGIAVMGIGFGMGPRFAPYRAAFAVLPGFNQARVPARWALAMMFAVTVLAALGSSELATFSPPWRAAAGSKGPSGRDRRWLAPLIVGLAALAVGVVPAFDVPFRLALQWAVVFLAVALAANGRVPVPALWRGGLTCGLIAAELVWPALHSPSRSNSLDHSYPAAERPVTRFLEGEPGRLLSLTANPPGNLDYLQATLYPNANATYGLRSIDGYDAGVQITRRWADTLGVLAGVALTTVDPARDQLRPPLDAHRLGRLGVRWVLLDRDVRDAAVWLPGWRGPAFVDGTVEVWENPSYRGEARVVTTWSPDGPLLPTDDDRARIEGVAAGWSISTAAPGAAVPAANSVEVKRTRPEVIDIGLAETSPAGYLVVEEQFDPGWRAEFDGQPVPIIAADGMFMGIAVAPGNHRVVLRYRAPRLRLGLALAVVGAAAVGGLLLWDPLRRRSASVQAGRATQNND